VREGTPLHTDRQQLREVAYASSDLLGDRAALYNARVPPLDLPRWVAERLPALPGPIIDVGCGPGWYLRSTARATGRPAFGFDLSEGMAREAATAPEAVSQTEVATGVADAQALPVRSDSAGAVLLLHMLYHVPDPELALGEARRVVHPEGVVAVMTNTHRHLGAMRELFALELEAAGIEPLANIERHFDDVSGPPLLHRVFDHVEEHVLDARVELDRPGPALAHLATARHLYAEVDDDRWQAVLGNVARHLVRAIERDGRWSTPTSTVFYLCRR
jgi:SAM-dependent methyltransferase